MTSSAIQLLQLGKKYRIRDRFEPDTLVENIARRISSPIDWFLRRTQWAGYRELWALKDIDLEIAQGEVTGLLGRNGAGKSTLLKIIGRITEPTTGMACITGRVGSLLEVAVGFHPELTGRENIYLSGAILGMKRAEIQRKFDAIVEFAENERFLEVPVKRYSSGMYVRLAFAVAAHLDTDILLIDEVLAVGDLAFQKKCLRKMGEVSADGRTVILVSHNISILTALSKTIVYLREGRLECVGPAGDVIAEYQRHLTEAGTGANELSSYRSRHFGVNVRFCEISLHNGDQGSFRMGEPIGFDFSIQSDIDTQDLSIACTIYNSSSHGVLTYIAPSTFNLAAGERLGLRLILKDVHLAPDEYYAAFSIGRGGADAIRMDYDVVVGVPAFRVVPVDVQGQSYVGWQSGRLGYLQGATLATRGELELQASPVETA